MVGNHRIVVMRKKSSWDFRENPKLPDSWDGNQNCKNNMQDSFILYDGQTEIWRSDKYQTVANMPGARHQDTIAVGDFFIEWEVSPNQHRGHVHGIIDAVDVEGQEINGRSMETTPGKDGAPIDTTRWLVHDDQKLITSPPSRCRAAWSAGCFIGSYQDSEALYAVGTKRGFKSGDHIPVLLMEVLG